MYQFIFFLILLISSHFCAVPPQEREALVSFYQSTNGRYWINNQNWLKGDPCENNWHGIGCRSTEGGKPKSPDDINDHVYVLNLASNNLTGPLPKNIGNLSKVQWLSLDIFNHLNGTLPESIGLLTDVTLFSIAGCGNCVDDKLVGAIPEGICNMKQLMILHFGDNGFTSLPSCFAEFCPKIPNCSLGGNPLKCPVSDCVKTNCGGSCQ